jgi:hypothetical protein
MRNVAVRPSEGNVVTFATEDGDEVRVEIEPTADDFMPIRGDRSLGGLEVLFTPVFLAVGKLIRDARRVNPDAITIRFGVKLTGEGGAMVARDADGGNFEITLSWSGSSSISESELR